MQRFLYSSLFYLAVPLILLRLLWRSIKAPAYRSRWSERFALTALPRGYDPAGATIWIHAVSVGETVAAEPLVKQLRLRYPQTQILITTMTPTGSARVRQLFSETVFHCYIPYDLPGTMNRFIGKYKPSLLILMETELWPNTIRGCHRQDVKVLLANARLSEKSARGYQKFSGLSKAMFAAIDFIAVQAEADAKRFEKLGFPAANMRVTGSLKFNIEKGFEVVTDTVLNSIAQSPRKVLIAASTREGEEQKVLTAFKQILLAEPTLLLLLIPRHPERFNKVASLCEQLGLNIQRRSEQQVLTDSTQVFVGDSMGEMALYYSLADIAFVGGSLVDTGCQNVLEPAAIGLPVLVGPSQFNFATICKQLEQAGALLTIADEDQLAGAVVELLENEQTQANMGSAGKRLVEENQQALPRLLEIVDSLL